MDDVREHYPHVKTALDEISDGIRLLPHVVWRFCLLANGEGIEYATHDLTDGGDRTVSGRVVAYTSRRVIVAELTRSPSLGPLSDSRSSTVSVTTWRRDALTGLAIVPDADRWRNPDATFAQGDDFLASLAVTAMYGTVGEHVTLPLSDKWRDAERFRAFLPSLQRDLDQATPS